MNTEVNFSYKAFFFIFSGDVLGKFTFSSDRYAVLESAGHIEVDILFHRNLP